MNINWTEIVSYILTVALGALSLYFRHSAAAQSRAANVENWLAVLRSGAEKYIVQAEETFAGTQRGSEKFKWVVDVLYAKVPTSLKKAITKEMIEDIVQGTFDAMAEYATTQLDRLVAEVLPDEEV
jgi:hypothetical protein